MSSVAECRLVAEWTIPAGELISVATSSHSECLLACRNQLYLLQIGDASLTLIKLVVLFVVLVLIVNTYKDQTQTKLERT